MTQIWVNGILVNALEFHRNYAEIDYKEAERILTTVPILRFEISAPGSQEALGIENLPDFKEMTGVKFEIHRQIEEIDDTRDIERLLEEAGQTCVARIEAHLNRLGGFIDFTEPNVRQVTDDIVCSVGSVTTLFINQEGNVAMQYHLRMSSANVEELESMLRLNRISAVDLLEILGGLKNINGLNIHTVDWGQQFHEFFPA